MGDNDGKGKAGYCDMIRFTSRPAQAIHVGLSLSTPISTNLKEFQDLCNEFEVSWFPFYLAIGGKGPESHYPSAPSSSTTEPMNHDSVAVEAGPKRWI